MRSAPDTVQIISYAMLTGNRSIDSDKSCFTSGQKITRSRESNFSEISEAIENELSLPMTDTITVGCREQVL